MIIEGNRASSACQDATPSWAQLLALSFAGLVLAGCGNSSSGPSWVLIAHNDGDPAQRIRRDAAGCYWITGTFNQNPLLDEKGSQWCETPSSDRTAISVAPGSAKTGSTR